MASRRSSCALIQRGGADTLFRQSEVAAYEVALEVGAAEAEVAVGEGIESGVGFQIFVGEVAFQSPNCVNF